MTNMETKDGTLAADVAICGAGPVGMALAALLARRGVAGQRIVLIDGKSLGQAISDPRSIVSISTPTASSSDSTTTATPASSRDVWLRLNSGPPSTTGLPPVAT